MIRRSASLFLCVALAAVATPASVFAVDVDGAKALARASNCFKCHGVEKGKDGPAWKEVADKYRSKADAEQSLTTHITTGPQVKFPDGHEEDHTIVKSKDPGEIKNLVDWILSL